jgi:TolB-like protein
VRGSKAASGADIGPSSEDAAEGTRLGDGVGYNRDRRISSILIGAVQIEPEGEGGHAPGRTGKQMRDRLRPALPLPDRPAIAVLPFTNMTGDPGQEYFSDGISEEIITALSKLRWFFVIARNSSFIYKGKAVHLKEIAEELGVGYVVEGSVRRGGDRVRITAQLNDAPPAAISGRSATTASLPTCSPCRMRSPRRSSRRSNRSSMLLRISAPAASRPTMATGRTERAGTRYPSGVGPPLAVIIP